MPKEKPVSFWSWMLILLVTALPCIGPVMILVWAFSGENETRKNYFRAVIAWSLILFAIFGTIAALGYGPEIQKQAQSWLKQLQPK